MLASFMAEEMVRLSSRMVMFFMPSSSFFMSLPTEQAHVPFSRMAMVRFCRLRAFISAR